MKTSGSNIKEKDILNNKELRKNPFTTPDGYFSDIENDIREKIHSGKEKSSEGKSLLRAAMTLALSFLLIFAIGAGIMKISEGISLGGRHITAGNMNSPEDSINIENFIVNIMDESMAESTIADLSEKDYPELSSESIEDYLINSDFSTEAIASLEK
ncbi:MAG: hypothetical protein LKI53_03720 [Bacteroidales bacterium]|jgi:hypothetical protein|nr:hypothetical protein [Bacteroidales bacterium]